MKKFIRCAKCDCRIEPSQKKLKCDCGNPIAGFCRKHRVVYDVNILPQCPVCIKSQLTSEGRKKLKVMLIGSKNKIIMITASDGVKLHAKPEQKESRSSYTPSYHYESRGTKPMPKSVATRLAGQVWI